MTFGGEVLALLLLIQIKIPYGTITIEVDPRVAEDLKVQVLDSCSGWSVQLREGEYELTPGTGSEKFQNTPRTVRVSFFSAICGG